MLDLAAGGLVRAGPAYACVVTGAPDERVVAATSLQHVVPSSAA